MKLRTILIVLPLLTFLSVSTGGYLYYHSLQELTFKEAEREASWHCEMARSYVSSYLSEHLKPARTLAGLSELSRALVESTDESLVKANCVLDHFCKTLEADVCYLIDDRGNTLASSNRADPDSFVGQNYSFRPYFQQALGGSPGIYMAKGVTSTRRGVYYSYPVYGEDRANPLGVAVIKAPLEVLERELSGIKGGIFLLVDSNGVIFLSNRDDWLFRSLGKIASEQAERIVQTRQFGKGPYEWIGLEMKGGALAVDQAGHEYLVHRVEIETVPGWSVIHMSDFGEVYRQVAGPLGRIAGTIIFIFCGFVGGLVFFLHRRAGQEIVRQKASEQALKDGEEKLRMLIDNLPNIIFQGYQDWSIEFFDDKIEQITGYKKEEFNARKVKWVDLVVEEDLPAMMDSFLSARKGKSSYMREYRIRTRGGEILWIQEGSQIAYDENGNMKFVAGAFLNITDCRRAEDALRESREKLSKAFSASPDGITIATLAEGRFIDANEAFLKATGYEREELIGRTSSEVGIWDDPQDRTLLVRMLEESGSVRNLELKLRKKSGEVRTTLCSSDVIELGGQACSLVITRDITEHKRLEEQLRQGQKLKSIGVLAGGVAHDFNNLLQIIQGYAELLFLFKTPEDPEYRKLEGIIQAARRGGDLTQQMLTFSRKLETKRRPIDLNQVVNQVVKLVEHVIPKKIEIKPQLASRLKVISADPIQIEQVIMNLVVNSKDALPDGGKIIIETRNTTLDEEHCRTYPMSRPGDYVLLSVSDTGSGMDRDTLDCIFEPFYSTKGTASATGLGLAIVYGIVQSHEGHVICYSEPGMGTTFKIFLPAIELGEDLPEAEETHGVQKGAEVILLVDDEELLHELVTEILTEAGYSVLSATHGEKALEIYRQEKDRIGLVLLDLIMPGMGGKRCIQELKKINSQVKILVSSGYGVEGSRDEIMQEGASGFVSKPYEVKELLQLVREVLDGGAASGVIDVAPKGS